MANTLTTIVPEPTPAVLDSIIVGLNGFHYERLRCLDRLDFRDVQRTVRRELPKVTASRLVQGVVNLKRYYAGLLLDPLNLHVVPAPVAVFLRAHILSSRDYQAFSEAVFGEYVHHEPLIDESPTVTATARQIYKDTLTLQRNLFGATDSRWWPRQDRHLLYHPEVTDPLIRSKALFPARQRRLFKSATKKKRARDRRKRGYL